jgi:hypothetical protein
VLVQARNPTAKNAKVTKWEPRFPARECPGLIPFVDFAFFVVPCLLPHSTSAGAIEILTPHGLSSMTAGLRQGRRVGELLAGRAENSA